jgi:hypothetical protein
MPVFRPIRLLSAVLACVLPAGLLAAPLPPMRFASSIAGPEVHEALRAHPAFALLDRELYGSPIMVLVTHTRQPSAGGQTAGVLTGALAGSTLGLIPIVSSDNLVVRYEILSHGREVAGFTFERKLTRAVNMWNNNPDGDGTYGLGKEGLAWLLGTVDRFGDQAARDPRVQRLGAEYRFYFGEYARAPAAAAGGEDDRDRPAAGDDAAAADIEAAAPLPGTP